MGMAGAAGKRWLRGAGLSYVEQGVTILGDDLYCNQPMCELLLERDYNFIPSSSPRSNTFAEEDRRFPPRGGNECIEKGGRLRVSCAYTTQRTQRSRPYAFYRRITAIVQGPQAGGT